MRVLILTPSFLPYVGGLEMVLDHLARALQRQGHEVAVLCERPRSGSTVLPSLPYPVQMRRRALSQRGNYGGLRRQAQRWHRLTPFDLVSAHMAYPAGWVAWRLQRTLGIPAVVTCHGGDVSARSRYRERPRIVARLAESLRGVAAVTAVSAELAESVAELAPGAACRVLPNGVDPALAEPVERPTGAAVPPRPFALYLKRFHEAKGHEELIEAWARLLAVRPETPDLVLAGDGPRLGACGELVRARGLVGRVHLPGAVVDPLRRWLLQNCRLFVHPSGREGMPVVILEAMSCGRPVVAARAEGIASMIAPGESGLIVPPGDGTALDAALERALDPEVGARWGAAGRERSREFAWDAVAARYLALFREVIDAG